MHCFPRRQFHGQRGLVARAELVDELGRALVHPRAIHRVDVRALHSRLRNPDLHGKRGHKFSRRQCLDNKTPKTSVLISHNTDS